MTRTRRKVEHAAIILSLKSDLSAIVFHFNSGEEQKYGPSYWKFKASLLDYSHFRKLITESVP